ncbi:JmjC domain-containing protein [Streptomyces hundungensis]|uniref:JmjC domain-containing protein n=1 Tax=Streptomyces hundungensis TaxID=1077946 RepID=UPI0033CCE849
MGWAVLDRLVGEPGLFFEACRRGLPQVFTPAVLPQEVPTLRELTGALSGGLMRTPYVEMAREGETVSASEFGAAPDAAGGHEQGLADPERIMALLAEGATLLLPRLDRWNASAGALTALVSQDLRRATEAFCVATMAGHRGPAEHRDDADVLVVQLAGRKEWTVYAVPPEGPRQPGPVPRPSEPALDAVPRRPGSMPRPGEPALDAVARQPGPMPGPGEPALDTVIGAGDVLYVPRGAPHTATGDEGLSVHLTLTIRREELRRGLTRPARADLMTAAQLLDTTRELILAARKRMAVAASEDLLERARGPLPAMPRAASTPRPGVG